MSNLVKDARAGDHLVFHFSGHGSQVQNYDGSEDDGMDEAIWPSDVIYNPNSSNGEPVSNYIIDDHLKDILVNQLRPEVHMTIIMDCCHSGTGADLEYNHYPSSQLHGSTPHSYDASSTKLPVKDDFECKMPYTASTEISHVYGHSQATTKHTAYNDKKHATKNKSKHVTSWSACMDGKDGFQGPEGGVLTQSLNKLLRTHDNWTYEALLDALSFEFEKTIEEARLQYGQRVVCPRPQLGSLRPTMMLLRDKFTL